MIETLRVTSATESSVRVTSRTVTSAATGRDGISTSSCEGAVASTVGRFFSSVERAFASGQLHPRCPTNNKMVRTAKDCRSCSLRFFLWCDIKKPFLPLNGARKGVPERDKTCLVLCAEAIFRKARRVPRAAKISTPYSVRFHALVFSATG